MMYRSGERAIISIISNNNNKIANVYLCFLFAKHYAKQHTCPDHSNLTKHTKTHEFGNQITWVHPSLTTS